MDISIIIVNWNTKDLLDECLQSIKKHIPYQVTYEVIVVDNASSDGSSELVSANHPWVKLIKNNSNIGFVKANNQASRLAKGRYLLLLNSDTRLLDGGILEIIQYFDSQPKVGIVTGRVLNEDGTFQRPFRKFPKPFGAVIRHTVWLVKKIALPSQRGYLLQSLNENKEHSVDWVTGAYLFIRRSLLVDNLVFDEDLFMYYEDTLFCYNIARQGYQIKYLPIAPIIHYGGKSSKLIQVDSTIRSFNSSVVYFRKVYGKKTADRFRISVIVLWRIFAVTFNTLKFVPIPAFRRKAELFSGLIGKITKRD